MDLTSDYSLDQYLGEEELNLFHKTGEHYDLLSTLSHQYKNVKIYDIGTYKGLSAIALSSNSENFIVSYDIGYFIKVKQPSNVEFRIGNFYNDKDMLNSPLIIFDIDPHDGIQERVFVDNLTNVGSPVMVLDFQGQEPPKFKSAAPALCGPTDSPCCCCKMFCCC